MLNLERAAAMKRLANNLKPSNSGELKNKLKTKKWIKN